MKTYKILIEKEIKNCQECPFMTVSDYYTPDGFGGMETWHCTKSDKQIAGDIEWYESSKIEVPDWCELLVKDEKLFSKIEAEQYINEQQKLGNYFLLP